MESSKDAILNNPSSDVLAKATEIKQLVRNKHSVLTPLAENAYQSFISHYREYGCNGVSSDDVDSAAKSLSKSFGLFEYATVA